MRRCAAWCTALAAACQPSLPGVDAPLSAIDGTAVVFRVDADLADPAQFYDLPFPSDLRLEGGLDLTGFPRPEGHLPMAQLLSLLDDATGFSSVPTALFRFGGPVAPSATGSQGPDAAALFVPEDPGYAVVPAVGQALAVDAYTPPNLLAVTPYPGFVLDPETRWIAVVLRSWKDAAGEPLGVPAAMREEVATMAPALAAAGLGADDVAAATVFTVRDVVAESWALTEAVRERYAPRVEGLAVDPDDGASHPRLCELHGTLRLPQFQQGLPPFTEGGSFVWEADALVEQRADTVPVVLTIPNGAMPEGGWPLVLYHHGSDGLAAQVIDRGPVLEVGGEPVPGLGPAHVLAGRGVAAAGAAFLLGPERLGYEGSRAYLNLLNLAAYRDTWRQGMIDARLVIDALADLRVPAETVAACANAAPVEHRFQTDRLLVMGQSAGAHLATELSALDARVAALAPSGSGGFWSMLLAEGSRVGGPPEIFAFALQTDVQLSILHPGISLLEWAWEPAEPMVYAARVARRPLPNHPRRHLYVPASEDDGYFPERIYDALALAYGVERAGPSRWESMDRGLALDGLGVGDTYPVSANVNGLTAVAVQWQGDGLADSHGVFAQLDGVKHQYGCFFRTLLDQGVPTVVAPGAEDEACD